MAKNNTDIHVATPPGGEHVQHIHTTKEDRAKHAKQFREQKEDQRKIKDARFAKINERRKKQGSAGGRGINLDVTSDS